MLVSMKWKIIRLRPWRKVLVLILMCGARIYRDLKQDYLKARNAILPQFQVEANERARIFSILSDRQAKSGIDRYSYFHADL